MPSITIYLKKEDWKALEELLGGDIKGKAYRVLTSIVSEGLRERLNERESGGKGKPERLDSKRIEPDQGGTKKIIEF